MSLEPVLVVWFEDAETNEFRGACFCGFPRPLESCVSLDAIDGRFFPKRPPIKPFFGACFLGVPEGALLIGMLVDFFAGVFFIAFVGVPTSALLLCPRFFSTTGFLPFLSVHASWAFLGQKNQTTRRILRTLRSRQLQLKGFHWRFYLRETPCDLVSD